MIAWFKQLDDLLRGRTTSPERLMEGDIDLPLRRFLPLTILFGALYGFFMGWFAIFSREPVNYMQLIGSTVKLPALYLLTLIVTFPSLYVFNAIVGCRLSFTATLRLLVGSIVVSVTVAASMGPILGFFTVSTTSYAFMILLNVVLLGIGGTVGLGFLLHTLRRLAGRSSPVPPVSAGKPADSQAETTPERCPGPIETLPVVIPEQTLGETKSIFKIWVIIYGLVGAQMGWLLRPFIGSPDMAFTWLRPRSGNFFLALVHQIQKLLETR